MKNRVGIVKEVYLLENDDNKIGFKIMCDDKLIVIEERLNNDNVKIYRNDKVNIITDIINRKKVDKIVLIEE